MYCFPSYLCIIDLVQDEGLRLANGAFSSSIDSVHVKSNVIPLNFHRELLAVKAFLRHYLLPFSPLQSLLVSEDLANSSWKFSFGSPSIFGFGHLGF